jgi:hypothetical protein
VADAAAQVLGVVTEGNLTAQLVGNRVRPDDDCTRVMYRQFKKVSVSPASSIT